MKNYQSWGRKRTGQWMIQDGIIRRQQHRHRTGTDKSKSNKRQPKKERRIQIPQETPFPRQPKQPQQKKPTQPKQPRTEPQKAQITEENPQQGPPKPRRRKALARKDTSTLPKDNPTQNQLKIKGDTQIQEEIITKDSPLLQQMNEVAKEIVNHGPRIVHKAWKDPTKALRDSCEQRKEQIIKEQMAKFIILRDIPEKLTQEEERYNQMQEEQEKSHREQQQPMNAIKIEKRYGIKEIRMAQEQDVKIRAMRRLLMEPEEGTSVEEHQRRWRAELDKAGKQWVNQRLEHCKINASGVMVIQTPTQTDKRYRIVIPNAYTYEIMAAAHNKVGHLGENRILKSVMDRFDWPTLNQDVKRFVASCHRCQQGKPSQRIARMPLQPIIIRKPNQMIEVDFETLCESREGYIGLLVIIDHFSKYARACPVKEFTAKEAAIELLNNWILDFGPPEILQSDRGSQFESELFNHLLDQWQITRTHSTPYHPQSNGLVERQNRTLVGMLRVMCSKYQRDWAIHAKKAAYAYNITKHASTKFTPQLLFTGREARTPLDLLLPDFEEIDPAKRSYNKFVKKSARVIRQYLKIVRHNMKQAQKRQKRNYDKRARWVQHLDIGQYAMVFVDVVAKDGTKKLQRRWRGPFKVLNLRKQGAVYVFKTAKGKLFTANYDKVRPYHARIMDNKVRPGDGEFALIGAAGDITEIEPTEAASTIHSEWTENSSEDPDAEDVTTLSEPSVRKEYPLRSKQQRYAGREETNPNYIPKEKKDHQTQPTQTQIKDLPHPYPEGHPFLTRWDGQQGTGDQEIMEDVMTQEDTNDEREEEEIHIEQEAQEWDSQHQETQTIEDPNNWYTLGVYPNDSETKSIEEDDREIIDHEWVQRKQWEEERRRRRRQRHPDMPSTDEEDPWRYRGRQYYEKDGIDPVSVPRAPYTWGYHQTNIEETRAEGNTQRDWPPTRMSTEEETQSSHNQHSLSDEHSSGHGESQYVPRRGRHPTEPVAEQDLNRDIMIGPGENAQSLDWDEREPNNQTSTRRSNSTDRHRTDGSYNQPTPRSDHITNNSNDQSIRNGRESEEGRHHTHQSNEDQQQHSREEGESWNNQSSDTHHITEWDYEADVQRDIERQNTRGEFGRFSEPNQERKTNGNRNCRQPPCRANERRVQDDMARQTTEYIYRPTTRQLFQHEETMEDWDGLGEAIYLTGDEEEVHTTTRQQTPTPPITQRSSNASERGRNHHTQQTTLDSDTSGWGERKEYIQDGNINWTPQTERQHQDLQEGTWRESNTFPQIDEERRKQRRRRRAIARQARTVASHVSQDDSTSVDEGQTEPRQLMTQTSETQETHSTNSLETRDIHDGMEVQFDEYEPSDDSLPPVSQIPSARSRHSRSRTPLRDWLMDNMSDVEPQDSLMSQSWDAELGEDQGSENREQTGEEDRTNASTNTRIAETSSNKENTRGGNNNNGCWNRFSPLLECRDDTTVSETPTRREHTQHEHLYGEETVGHDSPIREDTFQEAVEAQRRERIGWTDTSGDTTEEDPSPQEPIERPKGKRAVRRRIEHDHYIPTLEQFNKNKRKQQKRPAWSKKRVTRSSKKIDTETSASAEEMDLIQELPRETEFVWDIIIPSPNDNPISVDGMMQRKIKDRKRDTEMHHDTGEYSEGGDGQSNTSDSGNSSDRVANLQDLTETPKPIIHQQQQRYFMIKPTMDVPEQDQFDSQQETVRTQFYVEIPTPETMEEGCRLDTNITIEVVDSILPYLTKGYEPDGIPEGIKHICLPTRHIKMIRRKNILKHRGAIIIEIPLANIKKVNKRREIAKTYGIPDRCFNGSKWYLGNTTIVRVEEKYVFVLIVREKESEDIPWNCYERGVTRTAWLAKNCAE